MDPVFDNHFLEYDEWYDKNKFAYFSEITAINKAIPKKGKGLEVGVGTGRFASLLGIKDGLDPSSSMLKLAKERGINARLGFGESLPFADEAYDFITIIITLCFVKDPEKVISEAYRVLRKKGRIIIGIIDKESFLGKYYQLKKSIFYSNAIFFSTAQVVSLLKKHNFRRFRFFQTLSCLPKEMKAIEKPRRGFGKSSFVVIAASK